MSRELSPVWRFAVPVKPLAPWVCQLFTTQTATPPATSGSGGPRVGLLNVPGPVMPLMSQSGSLALSQFVRHASTCTSSITGKLNDVPVQPLSRSLPPGSIVVSTRFGLVASPFVGQVLGPVGSVVLVVLPLGRQTSVMASLSVFGLEIEVALILSFSLAFFGPFLPCFSGTATMLSSPQTASEMGSVGVLRVAPFT